MFELLLVIAVFVIVFALVWWGADQVLRGIGEP